MEVHRDAAQFLSGRPPQSRHVKRILTILIQFIRRPLAAGQRGRMRYCSILGSAGFAVAGAWLLAAEPSFAQRIASATDYQAQAGAYWQQISEKRKIRFAKWRSNDKVVLTDYVLTQPPVYSGPPRPPEEKQESDRPARQPMPVVADFLKAAAEHYKFAPQRPKSDLEFKRAYAATAKASGLLRDQIVRIYSFETGGNGTYDVQAGLTHNPKARAISTALGYNQLLTTNTVSILAGNGDHLLGILRQWAQSMSGDERRAMERKIEALQRMIAYARSVPNHWNEHTKLAKTSRGYAMHALLMDIDIGPLLQVQKLLTSVHFARGKGHLEPLTAAELEMMNLTGDGNGFDLVTMPQSFREKVPTSNFFQRNGYERNPIARRTGVVAGLYDQMNGIMDRLSQQPGSKELASVF